MPPRRIDLQMSFRRAILRSGLAAEAILGSAQGSSLVERFCEAALAAEAIPGSAQGSSLEEQFCEAA